jgi:hypothetical protein
MSDCVFLLFEQGGRPLARYRLGFPQQEYIGSFSFEEVPSYEFKRTVATARLQAPSGDDVLPPLYEAKLLWCKAGEARVSGLEVDELTRRRTAQCWNVRFAGCEVHHADTLGDREPPDTRA